MNHWNMSHQCFTIRRLDHLVHVQGRLIGPGRLFSSWSFGNPLPGHRCWFQTWFQRWLPKVGGIKTFRSNSTWGQRPRVTRQSAAIAFRSSWSGRNKCCVLQLRVKTVHMIVPGEDPQCRQVWVSPGLGSIRAWFEGLGEVDADWFPLYRPLGSQSGPQHPEKHLCIHSCPDELHRSKQLPGSLHEVLYSNVTVLQSTGATSWIYLQM